MHTTTIAYCYDGTLEGLLTAIFTSYARHVIPQDIAPSHTFQARLGQEVHTIETDISLALRVQKGIYRRCGSTLFEAVKSTSLSDDPAIGTIIYQFLRYALAKNKPLNCNACSHSTRCRGLCTRARKRSALDDLSHPAVAPFVEANRKVYNERERVMQFLRFEHFEGDLWFAQCNPNASVVPLVMDWFAQRFNTQAFMIYDEVHRLAGVYEGRDWYLVKTDRLHLPSPSEDEVIMKNAWKRFYHTIAVESRYNPELRRQFMPKRLWKNITEMQEDIPRPQEKRHSSTPETQTLYSELFQKIPLEIPTPHTPLLSKEGIKLSSAAPPSCQ